MFCDSFSQLTSSNVLLKDQHCDHNDDKSNDRYDATSNGDSFQCNFSSPVKFRRIYILGKFETR